MKQQQQLQKILQKNTHIQEQLVKLNLDLTLIIQTRQDFGPTGTENQPSRTIDANINETTHRDDYKKVTTIEINKTNTLDIALTLADTWCVNLEKEYEYNGEEHSPGKPSTAPPVKTEEEDSGSITNSSLASKVRNKAYSEAKSWLNGQQVDGTVTSAEVLDGKQTTKINTTFRI